MVERFVFLGLGKYARADRIFALAPVEGDARGPGRRTLVWVDGIAEPLVASRSETAILLAMGRARDAGPAAAETSGPDPAMPSLF